MYGIIAALIVGAVGIVLNVPQPEKTNPVVIVQPQPSPEIPESIWPGIGARLNGARGGECVEFIQILYASYFTDPDFRGWAGDIVPNSQVPKVGDAVLESGKIGHAAIVTELGDGFVVLIESNRKMNGVIEYGRRLAIDSPSIRGYYHFKNAVPDEKSIEQRWPR